MEDRRFMLMEEKIIFSIPIYITDEKTFDSKREKF